MLKRIFINPDGSLRILCANPRYRQENESDSILLSRCAEKDPNLQGLDFFDADETDLPQDRSERHKWRVQTVNGQKSVFIDSTVI